MAMLRDGQHILHSAQPIRPDRGPENDRCEEAQPGTRRAKCDERPNLASKEEQERCEEYHLGLQADGDPEEDSANDRIREEGRKDQRSDDQRNLASGKGHYDRGTEHAKNDGAPAVQTAPKPKETGESSCVPKRKGRPQRKEFERFEK
jgi:hypothetical protein